MIKTTRWEQQYSIREPERYAWYSHWSIGHGQLSGSSEKRKNQYYKVISVFVCLYVCLKLNNYRTAGLIWLNFYLLAQSLSRDGFRPKKPDSGSGFFFGYQDGANKKKVQPNRSRRSGVIKLQTDRHTDKNAYYFVVWIYLQSK